MFIVLEEYFADVAQNQQFHVAVHVFTVAIVSRDVQISDVVVKQKNANSVVVEQEGNVTAGVENALGKTILIGLCVIVIANVLKLYAQNVLTFIAIAKVVRLVCLKLNWNQSNKL